MALPKLYDRVYWDNNTTPAINEDNLNSLSKAVDDIDDRVISLAGTIMEDVPQIQEDIEELEEDFALIDEKIADAISEANRATTKANEAAASVISAGNKALISEGYAKGTQNGTPVGSSSPYYHNNAEYFKEQARSFTPTGYQDLVDDVAEAQEAITDIEGEKVSSNDAYVLRQCKGNSVDLVLVGGSIAWNQLVQNGDFASTSGWSSYRCTLTVSNNIATVKSTDSDSGNIYNDSNTIPAIDRHKYFWSVSSKGTNSSKAFFRVRIGDTTEHYENNTTSWVTVEKVFNAVTTSRQYSLIEAYAYGINGEAQYKNFNIIDLTQMFGSTIADYIYSLEQATAGTGVAWFRQYFSNAYYGYQSGKIESVNVASRKVVGKNLVNPSEILEGYYLDGNGQPTATIGAYITGFIPIFKGQPIYIPATGTARRCTYDRGKNFVKYLDVSTAQVLTPTFDGYLRVSAWPSTVTKDNIMINYGSNELPYEPYKEYTFPFDSSKQLRGIPKLVDNKLSYDGDIYTADGSITRKYGIVDLGSCSWSMVITDTTNVYRARTNDLKNVIKRTATTIGMMCPKYMPCTASQSYHKTVGVSVDADGVVQIYDENYNTSSSADAFKTAMNGVYLVYELATPTTESANAYQNPQRAFIDGTEEFVDAGVTASTRDVSIPVGNESEYNTSEVLPISQDYTDGAMEILKGIVASSSDFADFKTKVAAL